MSKLKAVIQDENTLRTIVDVKVADITARVKRAIGPLEEQYVRYRLRQRIGVVLLVLGFAIPQTAFFILGAQEYMATYFFLGVILICVGLYLSYAGKRFVTAFNQALDREVYQEIFSLFGLVGTVVEQTPLTPLPLPEGSSTEGIKRKWLARIGAHVFSQVEEQARTLLARSELITEPYNRFAIDTLATIAMGEQTLTWSELSISNVTGSGKNRSEKSVFQGYFISAPLTKRLAGKTFIAAEGDPVNATRTPFWKKSVTETVLEWNEFEDLLHVATSNETEARYVLTPNFMHELYDWWAKRTEQIRLSFMGDQLYILFPDKKLRFNKTVANLSEQELRDYLLAVATPMLHVVHLVEEVRL
jgi:Protein of unknown function (DUF3137)